MLITDRMLKEKYKDYKNIYSKISNDSKNKNLIKIKNGLYETDASSLFAGKLHAVLCRKWQNRSKGRDLYDFVFYSILYII